jgi:hypothetical protein
VKELMVRRKQWSFISPDGKEGNDDYNKTGE